MSIRICHASIDENGGVSGGKAGDQTGKEVCVRDWWDGEWHTCLRPLDPQIGQKAAEAAVYLANENLVGYDQRQRNTLHLGLVAVGYDFRKLKLKYETDCSAFMTAVCICAGVKELEYLINAPVTSNMVEEFEKTGRFAVLTDEKYLRSPDHLRTGDILVTKGHTVMAVEFAQEKKEEDE